MANPKREISREQPRDETPDPARPRSGSVGEEIGHLSVGDPDIGKTRLLSTECSTCIFKHGNPMHLQPGRLQEIVSAARGEAGYIICHGTLPYAGSTQPPAICRGFANRYTTWQLQVMERLWGFVEVPPPDLP